MNEQTSGTSVTIEGPCPVNRFQQVLEVASRRKADSRPLKRPSLAEEFYRENPMPWLLDSDPVEEPNKDRASVSA